MVTLEEALHGSRRTVSLRRNSSSKVETYQVKIPRGVHEGQRIRLAGQGEAGAGGGKSGDLFLRVRFARHPEFSVEGSDLIHEVEIAPWQAALGAELQVPTLEGEKRLKIPAGTQAGQRFRLRERGLPHSSGSRGDLYIVDEHPHSEETDRARTRTLDATSATARWLMRWRSSRRLYPMKISLGTDHAGFKLKEKVKQLLESLGHEVVDFGTFSEETVDYPVFVRPAAEAVARGECERGIVFGGSGNGEAMAANKVRGVRCALCWNEESARLSRQHNDANVLSLGERLVPEALALAIVQIWLTTEFEGGRHAQRIAQLDV